MNSLLRNLFVIIFTLLPGLSQAEEASPQLQLERALIASNAGAWDQARQEMEAISATGQLSPALCYSLGNVCYRLNQPGQAAVWYYRALLLDPLQAESTQNLRFLQKKTGYPEWPVKWRAEAVQSSWLKVSRLRQIAIAGAWITGIAILWLVWWTPQRGSRWPLVTILCLVPLPALFCAGMAFWRADRPSPGQMEVVIKDDITAFASPAEAASTVISLPQGTRVVPIETRGAWRYCELPGNEDGEPLRGWIREGVTVPLWPWNAERWS